MQKSSVVFSNLTGVGDNGMIFWGPNDYTNKSSCNSLIPSPLLFINQDYQCGKLTRHKYCLPLPRNSNSVWISFLSTQN